MIRILYGEKVKAYLRKRRTASAGGYEEISECGEWDVGRTL